MSLKLFSAWHGPLHVEINMARELRKITFELPYHVTARCINKDWFRLPLPIVWDIFSDYLYLLKHGFNFRIHSFVLMSNHFHMIVSTPEGNISRGMKHFMTESSREITKLSKRINQTFGGPFHSSILETNHHYLHAYKYVYRNPVDAGICLKVEDYPYSTLHGILGFSKLHIPIEEDLLLFNDIDENLFWLNNAYEEKDRESIRKALKKRIFKLPKDRQTRKPNHLENDLV